MRSKICLIFLCFYGLILGSACNSSSSNEQENVHTKDSIQTQNISAVIEEPKEEVFPERKFEKGAEIIILGTSVRLRSEPNLKGEILHKANSGEVYTVTDITEERTLLSTAPNNGINPKCFAYHWYKVRIKDGLEAWVYGKFVYKQTVYESSDFVKDTEFTMNGRKYQIGQAVGSNVPPRFDNDGDPTGCSDFYLVMLYEKSMKKVYPVFIQNPKEASDAFALVMESNCIGLVKEAYMAHRYRMVEETPSGNSIKITIGLMSKDAEEILETIEVQIVKEQAIGKILEFPSEIDI